MKHILLLSGFYKPKFKTFGLLGLSKFIPPGIGKATLLALLLWISGISHGYAQFVMDMSASAQDPVTVEAYAESWNDWLFPRDSEIWWYVDDVLVKVVGRRINSGDKWVRSTETFKFENFSPGSTRKISAFARHENTSGGWHQTNTVTQNVTMPAYQPVSNVKATQGKFQNKVVVTWDINEMFTFQSYRIYANDVQVGTATSGVNSFSHTLDMGLTRTYTVRGIVNGMLMPAPAGSVGSTFNFILQATNDRNGEVNLSWNNFSGTEGTTGFIVERKKADETTFSPLNNFPNTVNSTSYRDNTDLIPGYEYHYRLRGLPDNTSDVMGLAKGKSLPNGTISGRVTTPLITGGIGVSGVKITVRLIGNPLPTSNVTEYTTTTNSEGNYQIDRIYYYEKADFEVIPSLAGHTFENVKETVTLLRTNPTKTANFIDKTSFTIAGTVMQDMGEGKMCPVAGVRIEISGSTAEYFTDDDGKYTVVVGSGGNYTLTPMLGEHAFNPGSRLVSVTSNTTGINFTDTTTANITGVFGASCNSYAGVATLKLATEDGCFSKEIVTEVNTGKFSVRLPAREWDLQVVDFQPISGLNAFDVLSYFTEKITVDITDSDIELDLVYRTPPKLKMEGIFSEWTCDFSLPIVHQYGEYTLMLIAIEEFNGKTCPAGSGAITLEQNITSNDAGVQTNILNYESGDTLRLRFVPGNPNRIAPHTKFIDAVLNVGGIEDHVYHDFLVTGHVPREKTFTTVTPEIPFHVLYNPPGDNSYSYLEKGQTLSSSITISTQSENELEGFVRVQLGPTISIGDPIGNSAEFNVQLDATYTNTSGSSNTTSDAITISTTASERFQTSTNLNFTGEDGDIFVGGALNMIYGITDVVLYDRDACDIVLDARLVVSPEKFATTFIYTLGHVRDVIVPELTDMMNYYLALQSDSAEFYRNQVSAWEQMLVNHRENKNNAEPVVGDMSNISFSGGIGIERSLESTRSSSNTIDVNFFIDQEVAVEAGLSFAGVGVFGGVAVRGRIGGDTIRQTDIINSTTVGFLLNDDDEGDSFSVDILKCKVHATPVFKLVSGRSSCPWEPGTLPREGVQLISNTYSQFVELSEQAVFTLQLGNLSQSNETRTYNLKFDNATNPNGASLTIGGSPIVGNLSTDYVIPPGAGINATITVRKGPNAKDYEGLKFTLQSVCDEQITSEVLLNAYFRANFNLTVAAIGNGTLNVAPGQYTHREGTIVNLFASPAQGHVFDKWVINGQEIFRQAVPVEMTANTTATAYFVESALPQHKLIVEVFGNGTATVPAGTHYFTSGSVVELAAMPESGNLFVKWEIDGVEVTENQTSFTISKDITVKIYFVKVHVLTLNIIGNGTTNYAPDSYVLEAGTERTLFASPGQGFVFNKWIVNGEDIFTQSVKINMNKDTDVIAVFVETTQPQLKLTISADGSGQTIPPVGEHLFISGQAISLNAVPDAGQKFHKWVINGIETTSNPANVTITGELSVVAYFVLDDATNVPDVVQNIAERILLYPNPTTGRVQIRSEYLIHTIEIFDLSGRIMDVIRYQPNETPVVDLSSFNIGIYFLNIKTEMGEFRHKVIKK